MKRWRESNRDRLRDYDREHRLLNAEQRKESSRRWYAANAEKVREDARRKRRENPEKVREICRRWYAKHPEQARAKTRRWQRANPDRVRVYRAQAHARRYAQTKGPVDPRVLAFYFIADWLRAHGDDVQVDHIFPLARGGTHTYENLQILPAIENRRKGAKIPVDRDLL